MTSIAVLGTGIMGAPMARNLAAAGFDVRAWNRSRDKAEPLSQDGIAVAGSAAEAAEGAEVLLTMLADGDAVRAAATPALPALADGAVWLQMSTVGAEAADALGELASEHGIAYLDAPVSGTKTPAEQGKLIVLASGPEDAREAAQPVFDAVGARTIWAGDAGQGSRLKLVVNAWLLALVGGLAESVATAEAVGVDPQLFLDTIEGGPLDTAYAHMKGAAMLGREYPTAFSVANAGKDARLVRAAADAQGLDLPLTAAVERLMAQGTEDGFGDHDMAAVVEVLRARGRDR